ncbi:MAG: SDR family oxidoreductase [Amnibacterium sp.]
MRRFEGRTAVVTGASRGIGLAIAERLVTEGARVVITARKEEALAEAVARLGGAERARYAVGRGDDPDAPAATLALAEETFGPVDLLVNNTGINPAFGPALEVDESAVRKMFDVNVLGAFAWSREAVRRGMAERGGAIVNVASIAGIGASPGIAFYGVTKAALISLTSQLAFELAPAVRVNAVAPAVVRTRFARALYEGREEQAARAYPLGRLGEPEDVAGPVAFLLSDDAAWITGQTIVIDGGGSLPMPG